MAREIDIAALKFLRRKFGIATPRGTVIFRQGDTSQQFFVVLQGKIELALEIPGDEQANLPPRRQVVGTLGPGEFFGEMAPFTGEPRAATATAIEDAALLYFDANTALELLRSSPQTALTMLQVLCDRLRSTNQQLARFRLQVRTEDDDPPASADLASPPDPDALPEIEPTGFSRPFDEERFWLKDVSCPICHVNFKSGTARTKYVQTTGRDSDFREIHAGINPMHYAVLVCPDCYFAAYADDFGTVSSGEAPSIRQDLEQSRTRDRQFDFNGIRDRALAGQSYALALRSYAHRRLSAQRQAGLYHRLAWLEREELRPARELAFLNRALQLYRSSLEKERPTPDAEGTLTYLIADLMLRIGFVDEGVEWLRKAGETEEARRKPALARQIRDRLESTRAQKSAPTSGGIIPVAG